MATIEFLRLSFINVMSYKYISHLLNLSFIPPTSKKKWSKSNAPMSSNDSQPTKPGVHEPNCVQPP